MSDWLDVFDGIAVGLTAMAVCGAIVYVAPTVIYWGFAGLYAFWSAVGVM